MIPGGIHGARRQNHPAIDLQRGMGRARLPDRASLRNLRSRTRESVPKIQHTAPATRILGQSQCRTFTEKAPLPASKNFDNCSLPLSRSPTHDPHCSDQARKKTLTAQERVGFIDVAEELQSPHPLIRAASERLRRKTGWDNYKGLRSAPGEVFHFEVTRGALDRALLIGDALIKTFEQHGIKAWVDAEKKLTLIGLGDTAIALSISEHVARTKHEVTASEQKAIDRWRRRSPLRWGIGNEYPMPPDYDYHPTGKLTISIGAYPSRNWGDTHKTSLEKRLHQVVAGALDLIEEYRIRAEIQERRRSAWQKAKIRHDRQMALRKHEHTQLERRKRPANPS